MMASNAAAHAWMMTRRRALGLALALPLTAGDRMRVAASEPAPDTWTYAGNASRTGVFPGPGLDLTGNIVELWRIDGNQTGIIVDPCGVCDGIVYYRPVPNGVSPEVKPLVAVDAKTGTELWRCDPPVTEPPTFFFGEPAIADGLLVMPTASGLLMGIDAQSGEERWIFAVQGRSDPFCPAIVDGVLYVSDATSVNAIMLGDTPESLWTTSLGDGTATIVSGTVSVDGDVVLVTSVGPSADASAEAGQKITAIHVLNAADGGELYRYQFRSGGETYQLAVHDGNIYSRADKTFMGRSYYFSLTLDGTERWYSRTSENVNAYPAVSGSLIYIVAGDSVWAMDAATGQTMWNSPPLQLLDSSLVLIDGVIYVGATPPNQMIYAVSATDGTLLNSIAVPFNGAQAIGTTAGVLLARSGINLVALGAPS